MASNMDEDHPPSTQLTRKSSTVYNWVILFLYDENTEYPFSCVSLASLENSNFPFHVIDGSMNADIRQEPMHLSGLEGSQRYCIFAKIEAGKCK